MTVHLVVPDGVDDLARPSGGNVYDRRLADGLRGRGHEVLQQTAAPAGLEAALASVPDDADVVVDGLLACFAPRAVERHAPRARLVVLAHMCFAEVAAAAAEDEHRALLAADRVVTVSRWARDRLLTRYALDPGRVHVAPPGVDAAPLHDSTADGGRLLCVGAVTRTKGVDVLVDALCRLDALPWTCRVVGPTDRDPGFAAAVRAAAPPGLRLTGPRPHDAVLAEHAAADLLVLPTRSESFGMVVVEALAHGVPVLASRVGGVPEALGHDPVPGLLVPPADPAALADALRSWLTDPGLRAELRAAAASRRSELLSWDATVDAVERALSLRAEVAS